MAAAAQHYDLNFSVITDDRFVREHLADIAEFEGATLRFPEERQYLEISRDCVRYRRALILLITAMPAALQHNGQYPPMDNKDAVLVADINHLENGLTQRYDFACKRLNDLHDRLSVIARHERGMIVGRKRKSDCTD